MEKIFTLSQLAKENQIWITDISRKDIPRQESIEETKKRIIKLLEKYNLIDNKHIFERNGEIHFDEVAEKIIYNYLNFDSYLGYDTTPQYPSDEEISENLYHNSKNLFFGEELFTLLKKQWEDWARRNENCFNGVNIVTLYNCMESTFKFYKELQKQYYELLSDYIKLEENYKKEYQKNGGTGKWE